MEENSHCWDSCTWTPRSRQQSSFSGKRYFIKAKTRGFRILVQFLFRVKTRKRTGYLRGPGHQNKHKQLKQTKTRQSTGGKLAGALDSAWKLVLFGKRQLFQLPTQLQAAGALSQEMRVFRRGEGTPQMQQRDMQTCSGTRKLQIVKERTI